jgi:hypothetical protein
MDKTKKIDTDNLICNINEVLSDEDYSYTGDYNQQDKPNCLPNEDIHFEPCELCKTSEPGPVDLEKNTGRLLKVKVCLNNICFGKKLSIGCIIYDNNYKIVAFKAFTTMLNQEGECGNNTCGTFRRQLFFVLPESNICDALDLNVRIIANYIWPCESCS